MQGLAAFVIFIVVSLLRAVAESQKKTAGQRPGAPPPVNPLRPPRPVVPEPQRSKVQSTNGMYLTTFEADVPVDVSMMRQERSQSSTAMQTVDKIAPAKEKPRLRFEQNDVVKGVIFAEVLGRPRAFKPWVRR